MKRYKIMLLMALMSVTIGIDAADVVRFKFYGSDLQVRFDTSRRVNVRTCSGGELVRCLDWLDAATVETIEDCLRIKQEMKLSDWAYMQMLDQLSTSCLGTTNEAVLMMAWVMDASDFDVAICQEPARKLRLLFKSDVELPGLTSYQFYEKLYYLYHSTRNNKVRNFEPLSSAGNPVSFRKLSGLRLMFEAAPSRTVTSKKNPNFSFTYSVNKKLIDFYASIPQSTNPSSDVERLVSTANTPLDDVLQTTLIGAMKQQVVGMKQQEAVQQLLDWVQTGFEFANDEEVWGYDRIFCAEETLFYPSCDSEDRSILLARLVRDVLGLDVVFLCYAGHTAIAVCFTDAEVPGAYVVQKGMHYVVCDPTYIGSHVGEEMPSVAGKNKTVVTLFTTKI